MNSKGLMMATIQFDRDRLANWYAKQHIETDPGVASVYCLPNGADERDIRFVEVNKLIGEITDESLEPIDFGVDRGTDNFHQLFILDVTPSQ